MTGSHELPLFAEAPLLDKAVELVRAILARHAQPSAWELLQQLEQQLGPKARWVVVDALTRMADDGALTSASRAFVRELLLGSELRDALRGKERPGREVHSGIDELILGSSAYRTSTGFQEMVSFMANFRDYAPFNNMLVRIQNPSCGFYATQRDWERRFNRRTKEDARPMLILATMHPVMLVYDLDQTEGPELPAEIRQFAKFEGDWDPEWLQRTIKNAWDRDRVRVDFKTLSSTNAGFATFANGQGESKMRIAVHDALDAPSRYGVLCHELAHIYLGHLGGDRDGWWPSRGDLDRRAMEVEAEATAYIVTRRAGLTGASSSYVSRYLSGDEILQNVSMDTIAKVAGRLESMATRSMGARRSRGGSQDSV